jgi:hypothetical protein
MSFLQGQITGWAQGAQPPSLPPNWLIFKIILHNRSSVTFWYVSGDLDPPPPSNNNLYISMSNICKTLKVPFLKYDYRKMHCDYRKMHCDFGLAALK